MQLGAVRPARLLRELREEAEDRLAPSYVPAITPRPGTEPHRVLGEEAAQRQTLLACEGVEDPADDRSVLSCGHAPPPSGR